MKWRRQKETRLYGSIRLYLSYSLPLSLCFLCCCSLSLSLCTHTHDAQNVCSSVFRFVFYEKRCVLFYNFAWKKCKKLFFSLKKRSPFPFPSALLREKKNLFRDEMNAQVRARERERRFPHFSAHHRHDGSLFFDSGSAREQSHFAQGTNSDASERVLFRLLLLFRACARYFRNGTTERDNFLCKILSSLPLNERKTLVSLARKRGYKTHSFTPKRRRLAMWTKIFLHENERPSLDLAFGSRIVDFTRVYWEKERDDGMMLTSRRHTFSRERSDRYLWGAHFHTTRSSRV